MRVKPAFLLLMSLTVLPLASGQAQINPFRGSTDAGLRASDFRLQEATARKLLQQSSPHQGETGNWSNPKTGASGRVTVVNNFNKGKLLCRKLEFASKTKGQQDEGTTQVDWCRTSQGWKIVSS